MPGIALTGAAPPAAAGWYGKLPSLGDFASRRLAHDVIEPWDAWLSAGLAAWRAADPDWLQRYLDGPSWRFLLEPGVLAPRSPAFAGVLMPSVDSVGRYYPLTLVQSLVALPADTASLQRLTGWLERVDDLAVDALHGDWALSRLESELEHCGSAPEPGDATLGHAHLDPMTWAMPLLDAASSPERRAWWWRLGEAPAPRLSVTAGLPRHPVFACLLAGELEAWP